MLYTLDGRQLTDEEAEAQRKRNDALFLEACKTGDFSKLNDIVWLIGKEVMEATAKNPVR